MIIKYFGVPGAGKTTSIVKRLSSNNLADGVWAISLTRATKQAFLSSCQTHRADINERQVRTLHSIAYEQFKLLKRVKVITLKQLKEFFNEKGFKFDIREYKEQYEEPEEEGNKLQSHFERIRLSYDFSISEEEHQNEYIESYDYELIRLLGKKYKEKFMALYKDYLTLQREQNAWDFTTFLVELYRYGESMLPSGELLILDEFHDFSPLSVRIVERMLKRFKHVLVAGDDDQAIYSFNGASPKYLLDLQSDEEIILDYSHRLPIKIAEVANKLISINKTRKPKYIKTDKPGGLIWSAYPQEVEKILKDNNDKTILILARHRYLLNFWQEMCEELDVPYTTGDALPDFFIAMKLAQELREKGSLSYYSILIDQLAPFIRKFENISKITDERRDQILKDLKSNNLNNPLIKAIFTYPLEVLFPQVEKKWFIRLNRFNEWKNPKIRLATIHSAKGLEADIVVLDTGITSSVKSNLLTNDETETRVWYVALTRAKEQIIEVIREKSSYIQYLGRFARWVA